MTKDTKYPNDPNDPNLILPADASLSAAKTREVAELGIIREYIEEVGDLCHECPYFVSEPDVNWHACRILLGEYPTHMAPCL